MNKAGNNEQFDTDILQCKIDILRARNSITLHNETATKNPETQNDNPDTTKSSDVAELSNQKNTDPIPIETIPATETAPLPKPAGTINEKEETETLQETSEIPSFDLAEEIMSEQRRITAIRRKAPGQKNETQRLKPEVQPADHIIEEPKTVLSEQEKIISEIVAKDIEKLCRGDYPTNSR